MPYGNLLQPAHISTLLKYYLLTFYLIKLYVYFKMFLDLPEFLEITTCFFFFFKVSGRKKSWNVYKILTIFLIGSRGKGGITNQQKIKKAQIFFLAINFSHITNRQNVNWHRLTCESHMTKSLTLFLCLVTFSFQIRWIIDS